MSITPKTETTAGIATPRAGDGAAMVIAHYSGLATRQSCAKKPPTDRQTARQLSINHATDRFWHARQHRAATAGTIAGAQYSQRGRLPMVRYCSWCRGLIGGNPDTIRVHNHQSRISHGICTPCQRRELDAFISTAIATGGIRCAS